MTERPLRILFVVRHAGHLPKFEAGLRSLAERGHEICLAFPESPERKVVAGDVADRLARRYPNFRVRDDAPTASVRAPYGALARISRQILSDARHLSPRYARYPVLRGTALKRLPAALVAIMETIRRRAPAAAHAGHRLLTEMERATPVATAVLSFIREERPDVLLVTPLVTGPVLVDYVRAAARLGIPSCLAVASWDNLTTKGVLHAPPDALIVWNEAQKREAWHEFGFPPPRVFVTGAHTFDDLFGREPCSRDDFCRRIGLHPAKDYVLYVCSSRRIAEDESRFVTTWLEQLRASRDERVRRLGVLVRPHFQNAEPWRGWRARTPDVVVSPPEGENPITEQARADYYDAIQHSVAVVGLNTTALIEAGIVGRPVLTVVTGSFGQETMPHFHHLVDGGLLHIARHIDEHFDQLARAVGNGGAGGARDDFLRSFVRPLGLEHAAAPVFASAVEAIGGGGADPLVGTRPPELLRRLAWRATSLPLTLAVAAALPTYRLWRTAPRPPRPHAIDPNRMANLDRSGP